MSGKEIDSLITSNLFQILGFSEKTLVEYIKTSAKASSSLEVFKKDLENIDLPIDEPKSQSFINEIYNFLNNKNGTSKKIEQKNEIIKRYLNLKFVLNCFAFMF